MQTTWKRAATWGFGLSMAALGPIFTWANFYTQGKKFALRDPLKRSDAIVVLAGARGNLKFLDSKIRTAIDLYQRGWAPCIIMSGRFSVGVTDHPHLIPHHEIVLAASQGRISTSDIDRATTTWDEGLGATYMRDQATNMGVPQEAVIAESISLQTRENAEQVVSILKLHKMKRIILITSPFHQLRTFLIFTKVMQPEGIEIINYYANSGEWNPLTWFFNAHNRQLVQSEHERIQKYRDKGDVL